MSERQRVRTTEGRAHVGETVRMCGWLHRLRRLGGISFLVLRDGYGLFQAVIDDPAVLEDLRDLQPESVIELEGRVVAEPQAPDGVELHDCQVRVLSPVTETLPFELNKRVLKPGLDVFLDHATVGLRHPHKQATFRLFAGILSAYRTYLSGAGFTEIQSPKLVGTATEGGANVFAVAYFGRQAYLAQSPQLYKQVMVGVFERVFETGPVFRAEPHDTSRHINQYTSLDAEMGFIRDHTDVMAVLTGVVRHIFDELRSRYASDLELLGARAPMVGETIPSIRFREGQQIIQREFGEDCSAEDDLAPQHERWLCEWAERTHGSELLFVTHYPVGKRPFYTMPAEGDPAHTHSFDLLCRGTEIVTGGQRVHRYDQLLAHIERWGLGVEGFEGYLEAFRYGMPPHGGFGMGAERLLLTVLGATNLRETTLFPRDIKRLAP
ncbi:MAG: aspartate--tRNA(Asn) ligase [Anaerolineae bacterium]|nr:aspartate--tRNA(Asn) ligase [Anaerolineae bacterium]